MSSDTRTRAPAAAPADALDHGRFPPGAVVAGRYRVVALLGRGGMGEVYRAEDLKLRQAVALKFLPSHLQSDPGRLARFHREVRLAREVTHPNVCRVHDIGEVDGLHFLSMEYVDGEDLASLLRRIGHLPRDKAIEVARQVCSGLAAAHNRGVVHRDLKPANIMVDGRGRVRITDFGLAVIEEEAAGEVAGTPGYMAPEQLAGASASVRTDVYALGLVLYEVMTGRPAFAGGSVPEILRRQRESVPPRPSSVVPDIEPQVERVILRCLEKDPTQRPPSALAVAAALPGGDPLAALVAAGETPPPEMVADAGGTGALRPSTAWALLALVAAAVPLGLWIVGRLSLVGPVALGKPPEALADRARDILGRLGYPPEGGYDALGFRYDRAALATREWSRAVRFWYRVSPEPLQPRNPFANVSPDDPPPLAPGMVTVWLDVRGRLLSFQVVPPAVPAAPGGTPEWAPLFAEAGLDPARFASSEVSRPPPVGADALAAWTGSEATAADMPLTVEAASWRGRPVFFTVVRGGEHGSVAPHSTKAAFGFLNLAIVLAALVFVHRNLRRGRGDREGAFRLAAVAFAATLVSWAIEMSPAARVDRLWRVAVAGTELALWNAAWIWVLYLAIEPFVRRRWPESLISWSRLLAGRFTDARVGRDVLIGVASMCVFMLVFSAGNVAAGLRGHEAVRLAGSDLGIALGLRPILVWLLDGVDRSLSICATVLALLLLLRTLFRRVWVAVLAVAVIFGLIVTPAAIPGARWTEAIGGALAIVVFFGVVRFGLLAMAVIGFFMDPLFPITSHLGAWYGRPTLAFVLVTAAMAIYGFVVSLGGRSPFGEGAPED